MGAYHSFELRGVPSQVFQQSVRILAPQSLLAERSLGRHQPADAVGASRISLARRTASHQTAPSPRAREEEEEPAGIVECTIYCTF